MRKSGLLLKYVAMGLVFLALLIGATFWMMQPNIHTVVSGEVYRSAQLKPDELRTVVRQFYIRSVINLRGKNPQQAWYRNEIAEAKRLGVKHFDVRMNAYQRPSVKTLRKLVYILQTAPKPTLIHCQGGSDRTGLASAMVLLLKGKPYAFADKQVSILYFAYRKDSVGRLVLPKYKAWLQAHHDSSTRQHFLSWIDQVHWK